jgi:hypothetical protein
VSEKIPKFTHKGWMLFCPIKVADPNSACPAIAARWEYLEYLLDAAEAVQAMMIFLCSLINHDYEPNYWFVITGELE